MRCVFTLRSLKSFPSLDLYDCGTFTGLRLKILSGTDVGEERLLDIQVLFLVANRRETREMEITGAVDCT